MDWIHHYQLFLFDFDGILVNTELLHYQAYQKMCADRGYSLPWDWKTYCKAAMFSSTGLQEGIYATFPELKREEPLWKVLYEEKKKAYVNLLEEGYVTLMPGAERLLEALAQTQVKRAVVTHSPQEHIQRLRRQFPILDSIPVWITREDYSQPKPHPECYQIAVERLSKAGDKIIGFEDSPRGFQALSQVDVQAVFISSIFEKQDVKEFTPKPIEHYLSFEEMFCAFSKG